MKYVNTLSFLKNLDKTKKYCFVLGAGASVSSGIPSGYSLAMKWLDEIAGTIPRGGDYSGEIERRIGILSNGKDYERFKNPNYCPDLRTSLTDYNCICDLRFLGDKNAENSDLFQIMDGKLPYIGYFSLANILAKTSNDIVITTNFDELVEKAIEDYTGTKPYPIMHEALASYATESVTGRPKILKIHRDIKVGGYNRAEETNTFHTEWKKPLDRIFSEYVPIVIGYAGTDNSLMQYLRNNTAKGIYWCHMQGALPNASVTQLVQDKDGTFVEILEFDHIACHLASVLCSDPTYRKQIIGDITSSQFPGYVAYKSKQALNAVRRNISSKDIVNQYIKALQRKRTQISYPALFRCGIGTRYRKNNQYHKAIKWYQRAFDYELKHSGLTYGKAQYNLGVVLQRAGFTKKAEETYRNFLAGDCREPGYTYLRLNALNNYAVALLENENPAEAKKNAELLLSERRCDGDAFRILAIAEFMLDNRNAAIQSMVSAFECHGYDDLKGSIARDHVSLGVMYYSFGQKDEAKREFEDAFLLDVGNRRFDLLIKACLDRLDSGLPITRDEAIDILLLHRG